ncbi:hypothetical protein ARMSODRAFT_1027012 [Armillaria solidipes]|uniref:Uncharacterized protein n=1 Tax=Armillaria solidipes TaxID=1076256 RepID=A0A2H3ALX9_9AGAR|nr:hypothetical protein ARMSODRAFT_1027012 [Armillaria solidipes]
MDVNIFSAGYARLGSLFDMRQYTKLRACDIAILLNENHKYLLSLCSSARERPDAPISPFLLDMVHTCQEIAAKLPAYAQSLLFQDWELQLGEQDQRSVVDENTEWLVAVKVAFSQATTHKRRLEELEAEREEVQEPGPNETKPQASTSGAVSKTPMKLLTKTTAKATVKAGSQVSAMPAINEETVDVPTPQCHTRAMKNKFASAIPVTSEATTFVATPTGYPQKARKTQPGSIKEEPTNNAEGSCNAHAQTRAQMKDRAKEGAEPFQIKIKQKHFTALSTHVYEAKEPEPVTVEETQALTEVSTKPKYGCAQCSSSIQNQDCIFFGWGSWCNNCEAAGKSLCSFKAEPVQRYNARKDLAKFIEVTPKNLRSSIQRSTATLQVFEQCANAAALAAQAFKNSMSETLQVWQGALANEGAEALKGVVFEEPGFEVQLWEVLRLMALPSRIPTAIYSPLEAFRPTPESFLPVKPAPPLSDQDCSMSTSPADTSLIHQELANDGDVPDSADGSSHGEKSGLPPDDDHDRFIVEGTPDQDPDQDELLLLSPKPDRFSSPVDKSEVGSPGKHSKSQKKAEKKAAKRCHTTAILRKTLVAQAELVEQHPTTVIGNPKAEDMVFHIKQVFEPIQSAHSTTPTFEDYHIIHSFTRTIHSECEKLPAAVVAAIAGITTPAESAPAKIPATSGKPKASKAPAKRTSSQPVRRILSWGNPDASSAPPETDSVFIPSATIHRKADTIISHFERMNIDEDANVIVNRDLSAGNIVKGHKVSLPKFLKNKKAAQAAQREKEKTGRCAEAIQAAEVTIAKGKAIKAANQARKRPCASADHTFKDSPYTIAAADLAINNEASQSTIDTAASLVVAGDHINPSESVLRSREADLRNDVIATTHKIEYLLKYREFVVAHHGQVVKQLESCLPVPMEADSSAPVASGSKLN